LQEGEPLFTFDIPNQGRWTADFSSMRAYENSAGQTLVAVKIKDGMTLTFDRSASSVDGAYTGRTITIASIPPEADARLRGQERMVSSYSGLLRELRTDEPFIPPPPPGIEVTIGGKMGVAYRKLLPPGMDYQLARDFELPAQPSRRIKKKYKAWMQQARDMTKYRLKHETHFPLPSEAPPTTDINIFRFREMEEEASAVQKARRQRLEDRTHLGAVDEKGLHHFSGAQLAAWQGGMFSRWRAVETDKEVFEKQLETEQWAEQTENMELEDKRFPDAVFREEIFRPGSSQEFVKKFGVAPEKKRISTKNAVAALGEAGNKMARRRKNSVARDEICDEVAV